MRPRPYVRKRLVLRLACFWACACLFGAVALPAMAQPDRSVLVLYANGRLLPANIEVDQGLHDILAPAGLPNVAVYSEFLDQPAFSGEAFSQTMATYLRDKYARSPPSVVIAVSDEALDFSLSRRVRAFPGAQIIYLATSAGHLRSIAPLPPDVVGVPVQYDFVETVTRALDWHPGARHLIVVTGASPWDREWEARLRAEAPGLAPRVTVEFLAGLPMGELHKRLAALGRDSVIFTPGYFMDGAGNQLLPREAVRRMAEVAPGPVYAPYSTFMGTGVVGGYMPSFRDMGRETGQAVLRLLDGVAPGDLGLLTTMPLTLRVDWRQVLRWGIDPAAIPSDARLEFKAPTFWEQYRTLVLAAAAVVILQTALIAALLLERRRRRRTATDLAQSERLMGLAAKAAQLSPWVWEVSQPLAPPISDPSHDFARVFETIHPQDRTAVKQAVQRAIGEGAELATEYRVLSEDGSVRWVAARGRADGPSGQRLIGVSLDITQRKEAEFRAEQDQTALRHLTRVSLLGQLSASIAHQLNQPLTSILGNAEAAQKMLERQPLDLVELRDICADIVAEDQRAADIIRQLGALFKRGEAAFTPLDVKQLVQDTLALVRTDFLARHVNIVAEFAPSLPQVDGDRVQLQQLLLNLLANAADAMGAVPPLERQVVISTDLTDGQIRVCVADRGPGVADSDMERLFNPFWSTKLGGMGIGLTICQSVALAHGGSLSVSNRPEGGAVFCLSVPARIAP